MRVRIIGLCVVNLILALLYCMQGSSILYPRYIRYEGKGVGFVMVLLGPPCSVSVGKRNVLLHYRNRTHKAFDVAVHGGYVSAVYLWQ